MQIIHKNHSFNFKTNRIIALNPHEKLDSKNKKQFNLSDKHCVAEASYTKDSNELRLLNIIVQCENYNPESIETIENFIIDTSDSEKIAFLESKYCAQTRDVDEVNDKWYFSHLGNKEPDFCENNGFLCRVLYEHKNWLLNLYKNAKGLVEAFELKRMREQ